MIGAAKMNIKNSPMPGFAPVSFSRRLCQPTGLPPQNKPNIIPKKNLQKFVPVSAVYEKNTYLKKQTQFSKHINERKAFQNKTLRPIGHLVQWDKANPNKPSLHSDRLRPHPQDLRPCRCTPNRPTV